MANIGKVTGCVIAHSGGAQLEAALRSLHGWTDQVLLLDGDRSNASTEIARRVGATRIPVSGGDPASLREAASQHACCEWIFHLDPNSQVPTRLGLALTQLIRNHGRDFDALHIPTRSYFGGQWLRSRHWWPGYSHPQLLKNNPFPPSGKADSPIVPPGRSFYFPADEPELSINHFLPETLEAWLARLNDTTDHLAEQLEESAATHSWEAHLAHFVQEWQGCCERGEAWRDGMPGFVLAFLSGFQGFAARAKLWDRRRQRGETIHGEPLPASVGEMLELLGRMAEEGPSAWLSGKFELLDHKKPRIPPGWLSPDFAHPAEDGIKPPGAREARPSITACILARNEAGRIEPALQSLQGWVDQILLIDNESEDDTVEIARKYGAEVHTASRALNFDAARNLAIEHARGEWIYYLDADERVPAPLAAEICTFLCEHGAEFAAVALPFKHHFFGKWMRSGVWWPSYCRPQLVKKGHFHYGERIHSGVFVRGKTYSFPANPERAVLHFSYDDVRHYYEKLNHYTSAEAVNAVRDGADCHWQVHLADFVCDWHVHFDRGQAEKDGMHGFVQSFHCAFYRFLVRAKVWEQRQRELPASQPVPRTLREMLDLMSAAYQDAARRPELWQPIPESFGGSDLSVPEGLERPNASPGNAPASVRTTAAEVEVLPLVWQAPFTHASGYGEDARNLALALHGAGEPLATHTSPWRGASAQLDASEQSFFAGAEAPAEVSASLVVVSSPLPGLQPPVGAEGTIARTKWETDGLPDGAVHALNTFDRIWVPSAFDREVFAGSGVEDERIAVIPPAVDCTAFAPGVEPGEMPGSEPFRFLAIFDWRLQKGWDVLLQAFADEFGAESSVGLVIKTWSSAGADESAIRAQADQILGTRLGRALADFPNIHLWFEILPNEALPGLYRAADAYVMTSRGEGWSRPLLEAMATGRPTIATAWGGHMERYSAQVGFPVRGRMVPVPPAAVEEVPAYGGQNWYEPDLRHLRSLLRQVVEKEALRRRKGASARRLVETHYSRSAVGALLHAELEVCRARAEANKTRRVPTLKALPPVGIAAVPALHRPKPNLVPLDPSEEVDFAERLGRPLRVLWDGDVSIRSSLALVNREFCHELFACPDIELAIREELTPWHNLTARQHARLPALTARRDAAVSGPPDVTIRHRFPPNWERPASGKLVVMQPWEFGSLPKDWIREASQADEVWVYSRWVRDAYVRDGLPAEKVRVVPLGVRTETFTPKGRRYPLRTQKQLRFLFVGGTIPRKGADLLLEAYCRAFTRDDDVALVVKDMGTSTFYQNQSLGERVRQLSRNPEMPEILYLDDDLSDAQIASLYRACHCVVLPYRGEGFGLAPLEGMACGLPAIVTAAGATEDYLDDRMALRVPSRKVSLPAMEGFECVRQPWLLEPDLEALVEALRWVRDHPAETRTRAEAASAQAAHWTWARSTGVARERLAALICPLGERATQTAKPYASPLPANPSSAPAQKPRAARKDPRPLVSLCMIVRNEEPRIGECLRSVRPHVDEMIVVDTGSSDRTREIAAASGAQVFDFPWIDSFAAARNASLDQACGEWIFWMDADDVLGAKVGCQLRSLARACPAKDTAYQVQVRIPPGPGEFSPSVVDHVKLFPNRPDLRFEHRIHEQILPAVRRAGLRLLFSDIYVVHQNYDRSPEGQVLKRLRDFRLLELDLADHPDHPFVLYNLGMTYLYATHEYEVAAHYLRRSLERSHPADSIVRKAYAMLVAAHTQQEDWGLALAANETGRSFYPDDAELLFQAGQLLQRVGRMDEAGKVIVRLIQGTDDPHYRSVDVGLRSYRGKHELALWLSRRGDQPGSERMLREIATEYPDYLPAGADLAELLIRRGQAGEARSLLDQLSVKNGTSAEIGRLRRLLP